MYLKTSPPSSHDDLGIADKTVLSFNLIKLYATLWPRVRILATYDTEDYLEQLDLLC